MDGFPSGQRGQTVNLLATPSKVRILPHPLVAKCESFAKTKTVRILSHLKSMIIRADVAQLAEQLICNQQVIGSSPIIGFMGGFPSGQRGQTVNLLLYASVVRIHLHPFNNITRGGAVWKLVGLITRRS